MKVTVGSFRHKLELQEVTETKNTDGSVTESWNTIDVLWCSIEPLEPARGDEYVAGQTWMTSASHRIRTRYRSGIVAKMRLLHGTRIFDIAGSIDYRELNKELHIYAVERL